MLTHDTTSNEMATRSGLAPQLDFLWQPGGELLLEAIQTVAGGGVFYSRLFAQVKREWLAQPEAFQKLLSGRSQSSDPPWLGAPIVHGNAFRNSDYRS
jgi:hypothetical protein